MKSYCFPNHAVEGTVGEEHEESFPLTLEIAGQQEFAQGLVGRERLGSTALFSKFKNHGLAIQTIRRVYALGSMDLTEEDFVRDRKGFGKGILKDIGYGRVAARFEAGD